MNQFTITEEAFDMVTISYEGFVVEIYSYPNDDAPGTVGWNYHFMDEDMGGLVSRSEAIDRAKDRLKSISADNPLCEKCSARHHRAVNCRRPDVQRLPMVGLELESQGNSVAASDAEALHHG